MPEMQVGELAMSHLQTDPYICEACNKEFRHYDSSYGIVKCPFCGSEKVKIRIKTTTIQKPDGETIVTTNTNTSTRGGAEILLLVVFLAVGLYFTAFILPTTLQQIGAIASVNPNIVPLASTVVQLIGTIVIISGFFLFFHKIMSE